MKIVINALSAKLGGGRTYLQNLLGHMPDFEDLDVVIVAPRDLDLPEDKRQRRIAPKWPTSNPLLRTVWERIVLRKLLDRERAAVYFCPGGLVTTDAPAQCRVVTMFRNMAPFDKRIVDSHTSLLHRTRMRILEKELLRSMADADLTIFISKFARAVIEARIGIRRAATIPHGISTMFRTHQRSVDRPRTLPAGDYVLYVSRFEHYKHHKEVVTGFGMLPLQVRQKTKLVLVGETNLPDAAAVARLRNSQNLQEQVLTIGGVPYTELPAYYRNARAIVFASSCENCPNILLEAIASGRPVLSSNVAPMPEFGGPGLAYFSPFDPADIAGQLLRVLTDEAHAATIARAAVEQSENYDWEVSAARTWKLLMDMGTSDQSASV